MPFPAGEFIPQLLELFKGKEPLHRHDFLGPVSFFSPAHHGIRAISSSRRFPTHIACLLPPSKRVAIKGMQPTGMQPEFHIACSRAFCYFK
jgi:hypothetical protein